MNLTAKIRLPNGAFVTGTVARMLPCSVGTKILLTSGFIGILLEYVA